LVWDKLRAKGKPWETPTFFTSVSTEVSKFFGVGINSLTEI